MNRLLVGAAIAALICGCGSTDGTEETISSSVVGSLPCYATAAQWYESLEAQKDQLSVDVSKDSDVVVFPGDRVRIIAHRLVDDQPGLITVTGEVDQVKVLSGSNQGSTCWLYSESNAERGPIYE